MNIYQLQTLLKEAEHTIDIDQYGNIVITYITDSITLKLIITEINEYKTD